MRIKQLHSRYTWWCTTLHATPWLCFNTRWRFKYIAARDGISIDRNFYIEMLIFSTTGETSMIFFCQMPTHEMACKLSIRNVCFQPNLYLLLTNHSLILEQVIRCTVWYSISLNYIKQNRLKDHLCLSRSFLIEMLRKHEYGILIHEWKRSTCL